MLGFFTPADVRSSFMPLETARRRENHRPPAREGDEVRRDEERWVPLVQEADVLLVDGGDAAYLCHWLRASGLADLLPTLHDTVWLSVSAGSMVMTPRVGEDFVSWHSEAGDRTLGVVDFSIFPHLDNPDLPHNTMAAAERWAADLGAPAYAIDDETAIEVVDGTVEVVSEGNWRHFA